MIPGWLTVSSWKAAFSRGFVNKPEVRWLEALGIAEEGKDAVQVATKTSDRWDSEAIWGGMVGEVGYWSASP